MISWLQIVREGLNDAKANWFPSVMMCAIVGALALLAGWGFVYYFPITLYIVLIILGLAVVGFLILATGVWLNELWHEWRNNAEEDV